MKIFDSPASAATLPPGPLRDLVVECVGFVGYRPEEDGCAVLIEPGDVYRVLTELALPYRLYEVFFEAMRVVAGHHVGVFLANSQYAIAFLVPDAPWLPQTVREHLERHMELEPRKRG